MQIDTNYNTSQTPRVGSAAPAGAKPQPVSDGDTAMFQQVEALNVALRKEPDIRIDKVDKAIGLIGQVQWPPSETIQRFSALLAIKLSQPIQ